MCHSSTFLAPTKDDPDEQRRAAAAKRLARTSPYAAHVHVAFSRLAVFWNRALFPRMLQASLSSNDKRRKQISLGEQRLMAVCVMQHGRNYEVSFVFDAAFACSAFCKVAMCRAAQHRTLPSVIDMSCNSADASQLDARLDVRAHQITLAQLQAAGQGRREGEWRAGSACGPRRHHQPGAPRLAALRVVVHCRN